MLLGITAIRAWVFAHNFRNHRQVVADRNTSTREAANLENIALQEFGMVANCIALPAPSKIARYSTAPTFRRYLDYLGSFFGLETILSPISSEAYVFCSISHFANRVGTPGFV